MASQKCCACVQVVKAALQRSMSRMEVDRLDCVQFHWWDYGDKRYLQALGYLADLQQDGLIGTHTRLDIHTNTDVYLHLFFYLYIVIIVTQIGLYYSHTSVPHAHWTVLAVVKRFRRPGSH